MSSAPDPSTRPVKDNPNNTADKRRSGLVIVNYGKQQLLEDAAGNLQRCVARRGLEQMVCGDAVEWLPTGQGEGVIEVLLPRRNVLRRMDKNNKERPLVANIDQLIIEAAAEPALDTFLLDKYTVAAELANCSALIVVNKADLLGSEQRNGIEALFGEFNAIGYTTLFTSAKNNTGIDELATHLSNKTSVFVGQSGVGKSSLIKRLLPELDIVTGKLSAASGQGKHTTTATTLYHLPHGGKLIDSPGVRDFKLGKVSPLELGNGFREFHELQAGCKFNDCRHLSEPGCAITAAVESGRISLRRYESYRQLLVIMGGME
ncbi:MAG: ribosome small subunit-dependent GTPase A [Gammaproteobacteria bacterium]